MVAVAAAVPGVPSRMAVMLPAYRAAQAMPSRAESDDGGKPKVRNEQGHAHVGGEAGSAEDDASATPMLATRASCQGRAEG